MHKQISCAHSENVTEDGSQFSFQPEFAVMKITEKVQNAGDKMLKNKDSVHTEKLQYFQICHFKRSKISFLVLPQ